MKPGSPRGGHHRLREGQVELVAEAEVIPTCVLTSKPEMRRGGRRTQPLGIRLTLLEPIAGLLDHLIKRVQGQIGQPLFAQFLAIDVPLGSVLDGHTAVPIRSSSVACREHGRALAQESRARWRAGYSPAASGGLTRLGLSQKSMPPCWSRRIVA